MGVYKTALNDNDHYVLQTENWDITYNILKDICNKDKPKDTNKG